MKLIPITSLAQLNALIAERVFHLVVKQEPKYKDFYYIQHGNGGHEVPNYTKDMGTAWEIVALVKEWDREIKTKFLNSLSRQNPRLAYSDLLFHIKPLNIAVAVLEAMEIWVELKLDA